MSILAWRVEERALWAQVNSGQLQGRHEMHDLEIVWPSGRSTFTPDDSPILIGRSSKASIVLSQGSVSRQHLEITWGNGSWSVTDPSTHGTFDPIGVKLAKAWTITTDAVIRVGGTEGVEVSLNLVGNNPEILNDTVGNWDQIPLNDGPAAPVELSSQPPSAAVFDPNFVPDALPGQHFTDVSPTEVRSEMPPLEPTNGDIGRAPSQAPVSLESTSHQDGSAESHTRPTGLLQGAQHSNGHAGGDLFDPIDPGLPSPNQFEAPSKNSTSGRSLFDEPLRHAAAAPPNFEQQLPAASRPSFESQQPFESVDNSRTPVPTLEPEQSSIAKSTQTNASEAILRLSVDGQDYSFSPGTEITVGRDPSCVVHLDERHSLVSRRHLRMAHDEGSWWLEDYSSKGTFVDDIQVKGRYLAEGAFIAHLGDRDTGTQVRITTAGNHVVPKRRSVRLPAILAVIALLALVAAAALYFLSNNGETVSAPVDAATAQTSTVMVVTIEEGRVANHSSGFMVADDLMVTTRYVAGESNPTLVGVASQAGESATVAYATSWVASHPYLDLAVLRVATSTRETDGGYVVATEIDNDIGIPVLGLGESSAATSGSEIYIPGFPASPNITSTDKGILELPASGSTNGLVDSFGMWPGCESSNWQDLIPIEPSVAASCSSEGTIEQALLTMEMPDGSAGPGSPVIQNGKVVAIVLGQDAENPSTVHAIASESFMEWLDDVVEAYS